MPEDLEKCQEGPALGKGEEGESEMAWGWLASSPVGVSASVSSPAISGQYFLWGKCCITSF
jgi:hypothetical protein